MIVAKYLLVTTFKNGLIFSSSVSESRKNSWNDRRPTPVSYTHLDVYKRQIQNIRREKDLGHRTNQKFHSLPYNRIYIMLEYKLKRYGIRFIKQEESYTSQCSPLSPKVGKRYAEPSLSLIHI